MCSKKNDADFENKNAILFSDCGVIKRSLTYKDVREISDLIIEFVAKYVPFKNTCVGLKMNHNIYIPSLVLSLQELQHAFIFLSENEVDSETIIEELGIVWFLTFKPPANYSAKLTINNDELFLCKNVSIFPKSYEDIYYIVRTSGTTDKNKFVKVKKFCIQSNISSLSRIFKITRNDVIYFGTPLTFDPSMIELLLALSNKACLLITLSKNRINPTLLYQTLFHLENGVTFIQIVPSVFSRWSHEQIESILQFPLLRILAFGGEPFPQMILNYERGVDLRIFNLYGITEVSCWASVGEISSNIDDPLWIGDALDDTIIEVRNEKGNRVIEGEGEIFIGSCTRICLVDDEQERLGPVYRETGDIATITNNKICYKGRKNDVFKRFGHKLHLSKIEEVVLKETGLDNKCIWSKKHSKLLLFFILDDYDRKIKDKVIDKIRVKLIHSLPKHCFPDYIDIIKKCPLTSHGKVDKNTLEQIYVSQDQTDNNYTCFDMFRSLLCKYFGFGQCQLDNLARLKFFDIGGNSILAVQLLNEFSEQLGVELPAELVTAVFEKDLNSCFDCLKNIETTKRKPPNDRNCKPQKKIKREMTLKVSSSYNFRGCVDANPLVFSDGKRVLVAVGSFSKIFAVIEGGSGEEVSKFILPGVVESSPTLSPCGNYFYAGCFDGNMYCLNWKSQQIIWTYSTGDSIKCKATLCRGSTAIVFGSYDKHIHCVDIKNGSLIWKTSTSESLISTPLLKNSKIYTATISGTCISLSEDNGRILWSYKSGTPIFGAPCSYQDLIIWPGVTGNIICLTNEGTEKWRYECGGEVYCSLIPYDNLVIFGCHDGNLYFLKVGDSFQVKMLVNLGDKITGTPCTGKMSDKDCVFAGTESGSLYGVSFDGHVIGEIKLPGQIFSGIQFRDGQIYVGCRDNNLYCVSFESN